MPEIQPELLPNFDQIQHSDNPSDQIQHSNKLFAQIQHTDNPFEQTQHSILRCFDQIQHSNFRNTGLIEFFNLRSLEEIQHSSFRSFDPIQHCNNLRLSAVKASPPKQLRLFESKSSQAGLCRTSEIMNQKVEEIVSVYERTLANIDSLISGEVVEDIIGKSEIGIFEQETVSLILKMSKEFQNFASSQK